MRAGRSSLIQRRPAVKREQAVKVMISHISVIEKFRGASSHPGPIDDQMHLSREQERDFDRYLK